MAAGRGYYGDALCGDVADCGTYRQQLAIATIYFDLQPRPRTTRERELVSRLIRAAVLGSPRDDAFLITAAPKRKVRKW